MERGKRRNCCWRANCPEQCDTWFFTLWYSSLQYVAARWGDLWMEVKNQGKMLFHNKRRAILFFASWWQIVMMARTQTLPKPALLWCTAPPDITKSIYLGGGKITLKNDCAICAKLHYGVNPKAISFCQLKKKKKKQKFFSFFQEMANWGPFVVPTIKESFISRLELEWWWYHR